MRIVYPCVSKRNNEISIRVKTSTCQQKMAIYITKKSQSLSCSARWFSDIPAMEKSSADKTHLGSLGGRPETGATPIFHRRQEWLQLMRIFLFFSFWLNNSNTGIKTERAFY